MSSTQVLSTFTLYDYEMDPLGTASAGTARAFEYVYVTPSAGTVNSSPTVNLSTKRIACLTDANGYWSVLGVRSQGTTEYIVEPPGAPAYRVTIPAAGAGPFQASQNKAADSA